VVEQERELAAQLAHNPLVKKNPDMQVVATLEAVQAVAPAGHLTQVAVAVPTAIKE
jgi:hypothetical protein